MSEKIKPGLPFRLTLKVSTQDDKPISDPSPTALKVSQRFTYGGQGETCFNSVPSDGIVSLAFQTPPDATYSETRLIYKGFEQEVLVEVDRSNDAQAYIQLSRTPNNAQIIKAGELFKVKVHSTGPIGSLNYVISNGKEVVASDKLSYEREPVTEVTLELTCPPNAVPQASLLIYTFLRGGEILADTMRLEVASNGALDQNFLNISSRVGIMTVILLLTCHSS